MSDRWGEPDSGSSAAAALRLAGIYLFIAVAWIVSSDFIVALFPEAVGESLQTLKGLAFVVVTAAVLFLLVLRWGEWARREARHAESAERLLTHIVDTVPVGVLLVSDESRITFVNPAAESLLGVTTAEAVGRTLDEIGGFDRPDQTARAAELLRSAGAGQLHLQLTSRGTARTVMAQAVRTDVEHPESGWVVAISDVTDAQDARDRSARLVRGYRYLSRAALAMTRAGSRRALLDEIANLAVEHGGFAGAWVLYQRLHGEAAVETAFQCAGGTPCDDISHMPQAYAPGSELLSWLVEGDIHVSNDLLHDPRSPWYSCARTERWGSSASLALVAPDDTVVVLVLFGSTPGYFDTGQVELLDSVRSSLAFALDRLSLDQRRLDAEEALAQSERSYRTMFEVHPQPMWVYDLRSLRFLAVNDAAVAKYGYTREEFARMSIADIRPAGDVPRLLQNVLHVTEGLDDAGIWTHLDKSGREFPVHIYSHALEWEGNRAELVMAMEVARVQ